MDLNYFTLMVFMEELVVKDVIFFGGGGGGESADDKKQAQITFPKNTHLTLVYQCRMLLTFAISLDLVQDSQNAGPDLDPNCLTL